MPQPFASIIVPSRNRNAHVQKCVAALLRMDYPADRFQIIVIDDDSRTPVFIPQALSEPLRVRVIRQPHAGPAAARNRGIASAKGPLLVFTDDDCRPHPDWLAKIAQAWSAAPSALIGGLTVNGLPGNAYAATSQFLVDYLYHYFAHNNPKQRFFTSNNLAGALDLLKSEAGFDATFPLPAAEDRDLCDRWRERGGGFVYLPDARVDHYHEMSFKGFLRQQFQYGRGASVLRARRSARCARYPIEPRAFYLKLFAAPFRSMHPIAAAQVSALLFVAQVCNVLGFFYQRQDRQMLPHRAMAQRAGG